MSYDKQARRKALKDIKARSAAEAFTGIGVRSVEALVKKGYTFNSAQEVNLFYKNQVKSMCVGDTTTLAVDGVPFFAYKAIKHKPVGKTITTYYHYAEL